jgi:predicted dienelactone hydrolase
MNGQLIRSSILSTVLIALPGFASAHGQQRSAGDWGKHKVGSDVIRINLTGTAGEHRPIDVLLFYPADNRAYRRASPASYGSRLHSVPLVDPNDPNRWVPLSFSIEADAARQGVPVDQSGRSFPLIIYSHPNGSDTQNQAPTLERLASHGYIVAAPWHEGDTREDQIIDIINGPRPRGAGEKVLPCFDAGPSPCSDVPSPQTPASFQKVLQDRARDITAILDRVPEHFRDHVDMERVGLLSQSRGSLTALAAAAGSTSLNIPAEPRIKAIMMMTMGARDFMRRIDLGRITVPSLFVASKGDRNGGPQAQMNFSLEAFNAIPDSTSKGIVILERAEHASFSSNRCAQMQATGAVLQQEPRAIGEQLFFENIMLAATSGIPLDYCRFDSFVDPVDIRPLVKTVTGLDVTEDTVPRQLDVVTTMRVVVELATDFFGAALGKRDEGDADLRFKRYLRPKFLLKKEGEVVSYAETQTARGRSVACDDPELVSLDPSCAVQSKDDREDDD